MSACSSRPRTLFEVSRRAASGEQDFDPGQREFLDTFYADPAARDAALSARPIPLSTVHDAYLAATAEYLARSYSIEVPAWSETHGNGLKRPFFAGGLESTKALLTVQSPAAFRRRMLFVSKDALSRPRSPAPEAETPSA